MAAPHGGLAPSVWVRRWVPLIPSGARVLDLACGSGRHLHLLAGRGLRLTGVDRDAEALARLPAETETIAADVENGPWPLAGRVFDAVVVTHYLWRPLWPRLLDSLAPDGVLIYETFAHGNASVGKPSRPDFLLQPGELLRLCQGLRVVAFEDGFCQAPERYVQRIVAVREADTAADPPPRFPLDASG